MLRNKIGGFKKALALGLIGLTSVATLLSTKPNIEASAHNAYFVTIAIDEANFRYIPTIVFEENSWVASNHREKDVGNFSSKTVKDKNWTVPVPDEYTNKSPEDLEKVYEGRVDKGDGEKGLIFTFPPIHGKGLITDKVHANGTDEMLANRYTDYVVTGLNDALNFCVSQSGAKGKSSVSELKKFSAQLANNAHNKSGSAQLNGMSFTVSAGNPDKTMDGLTKNDYVKISSPNSSIIVPMRVKKGYVNSSNKYDVERPGLANDYIDKVAGEDTEYIDWRYTVLQGNYNADVKSVTYSSVTEITKPSALTIAISDLFGGLLSGLRNLLGLYPMEDLMLNSGARDAGYYYGIMPNDWMSSANLLHIVSQIVAWTLMGFSFVRMLYKRQLQTMNIGERMSLMDGFKNLIFTAFLLGSFILMFTAMAKANYVLVELFGKSSAFSGYIGTTQTMNAGAISAIFINFAFFILNCYFNFFYVLRGVTVAILYGIAPLCIFTLSLGGRYTQVFSSFMKEMVSNIFIQTFHAICVAFFTSVTSTTQMRTFELLVVFMAFIPLTNFVRQNVFGLSAGITDHAQGMVNMGRAVVSGAVAGAVGGAMVKGTGGTGAGGSGMTANLGAVNPANASIQNAMANRQIHADSKSAGKGGINNNELMGNIAGVSNTENASNALKLNPSKLDNLKSGAKNAYNVASGLGKVGAGIAVGGTALGFGAMGDKMGVSDALRTGQALRKSGYNNFSNLRGGMEASSLEGTGISGMYDGGEHMTAVYNAKYNEDADTVVFDDMALNNSNYGNNMREMYEAFNGKGEYSETGSKAGLRDDAIARYKNQGIMGVGTYKNQLAIVYDKKMTEKKNFSPRNVGEISPYVAQKKTI